MATVKKFTRYVAPNITDAGAVNRAVQGANQISQAADGVGGLINREIDTRARKAKEAEIALRKEQEIQDATWVNEQLINAKRHRIDGEAAGRQAGLSNPDGVADSLFKSFEEYDNEIIKTAPSERAKSSYLEKSRNTNLNYLENNNKWEERQRVNNYDASVKSAATNLRQLAYRAAKEGRSVDDLYEDAQNTLSAGSGLYSEQVNQALKDELRLAIEEGEIEGLIQERPEDALREIKTGKFSTNVLKIPDDVDKALFSKVEARAKEIGVPVDFAIGIFGAETNFGKNNKTSSAGAIGAMQTMPATLKDPGFGVKPAKNNSQAELLRVGVDYSKAMFDLFDGDREAALIAYNAGHVNAKKWLKAGRDYSVLPKSSETKPYAERAMGYSNDYNGGAHAIDPKKMIQYRKMASDRAKKMDEIAINRNLEEDIINNDAVYSKFRDGEMDIQQLSALEKEKGVSPLTKMIRKKLTEAEEKVPPPSRSEQSVVFNDLMQKKLILDAKTENGEKIGGETLKLFKEFQAEVYQAQDGKFLTTSQGNKFLGDYSQNILGAINNNKSDPDGFKLQKGIQDPYGVAFKAIDEHLDANGMDKDLIAKQEMVMVFGEYLGDFKSSGNFEQDEMAINKALSSTKKYFATQKAPSLRTSQGTPNAVRLKDGSSLQIANSGEQDAKPEATVKASYKVMEDANGNKARVYTDGRIEVIN